MSDDNTQNSNNQFMQLPKPDPKLLALMDKLEGKWSMKGRMLGAKEDSVIGQTEFRRLPGSFFLEQHMTMHFMGMDIDSLELIGCDPQTKELKSTVFSNMSPVPLPYSWKLEGDELTITVSYGPINATFKGTFSKDGNSFSGGWRPNPGADEMINPPYDVGGIRLK